MKRSSGPLASGLFVRHIIGSLAEYYSMLSSLHTRHSSIPSTKNILLNVFCLKVLFLLAINFFLIPLPLSANIVGSDFQLFNPIPSGIDFVTVHSSKTLERKHFNLGLYINGATNALPYFESTTSAEFRDNNGTYHDLIGGMDINIAYGITKNFEAGISFPSIIFEDFVTEKITGHFSTQGSTEIRPLLKYQFWEVL